jgi:hypothetical protein
MRTSPWRSPLYDAKLVSDHSDSFNILFSCIVYIITLIFLDINFSNAPLFILQFN